jgi:hypothetical protein
MARAVAFAIPIAGKSVIWYPGAMRSMMLAASALIIGCDSPVPPASPTETVSRATAVPLWLGSTGTVVGQVTWDGDRPQPAMIETYRLAPGGRNERVSRPAPNVPVIESASGGVSQALVYLRGVMKAARPWDQPPVSIELSDERAMICQGGGPPRNIGLVHCGSAVTIVSRQNCFHALRARGSAFWTLTLPDADRPLTKRLDQPGIVELSSAAGYYWMHAYLFVADNPYCVLTDAHGRFELAGVPPGEYELITWMPSWAIVRRERDPESTAVVRVVFGPHHEWRQKVAVAAAETTSVSISVPTK